MTVYYRLLQWILISLRPSDLIADIDLNLLYFFGTPVHIHWDKEHPLQDLQ